MVFRGRFRSRIVILVLLVLALLYNSDKIATFVKGDESGLSQAHKQPSSNDNQGNLASICLFQIRFSASNAGHRKKCGRRIF